MVMNSATSIEINQLINNIKSDPSKEEDWRNLALLLAREEKYSELDNLLQYRHQCGFSGIKFAYELTLTVALLDEELIGRLYRGMPGDCAFSGIFYWAEGNRHLAKFDLENGCRPLKEGFRRLVRLKEVIPSEAFSPEVMNLMARQSFLVEDMHWVGKTFLPHPDFELMNDSSCESVSDFVGAFFCDSVYFKHYAEVFLSCWRKNVGQQTILACIVNPDADILPQAASLSEKYGNVLIGTTTYSGDKVPEYCTAIRFLLANRLLRTFGKPIILFDADALFSEGSLPVVEQIARYPLSFIDTRIQQVNLQIDASVVGAHPGTESEAFFDVVSDYLRAKLLEYGPIWTVDQVALHRGVSYGKKEGFSMTDLVGVLPENARLPEFFKKEHDIAFEERGASRQFHVFDLSGIRFMEDGSIVFPQR